MGPTRMNKKCRSTKAAALILFLSLYKISASCSRIQKRKNVKFVIEIAKNVTYKELKEGTCLKFISYVWN